MNHEECLDIILDGKEAESIVSRAPAEAHLAQCAACRETVRNWNRVRQSWSRDLHSFNDPDLFVQKLLAAIEDKAATQEKRWNWIWEIGWAPALILAALVVAKVGWSEQEISVESVLTADRPVLTAWVEGEEDPLSTVEREIDREEEL